MLTITTAQLATIIAAEPLGRTATFVMEDTADKDMLKKHRDTKESNPYLGKLRKISTLHGRLAGQPKSTDSGSYANTVNAQREREGLTADFVPQATDTYDDVDHAALRVNKKSGELHAHLIIDPEHCSKVYTDISGAEVDKSTLMPYLGASAISKQSSGTQGTDKAIIPNYPTLSKIVEARIGGKVYKITNRKPMTLGELRALIATPATVNP